MSPTSLGTNPDGPNQVGTSGLSESQHMYHTIHSADFEGHLKNWSSLFIPTILCISMSFCWSCSKFFLFNIHFSFFSIFLYNY